MKITQNFKMNETFFCNSNFCQSISLSSVDIALYLSCDQEETDTRIPRRCHYIPNIQKKMHIAIRSPQTIQKSYILAFLY